MSEYTDYYDDAAQRRYSYRKRRHLALAAVACVAVLAVTLLAGWEQLAGWLGMAPGPAAGQNQTRLHFVDVGQGDAVLIENSGEFALIDCGTEDCESYLLGYLERCGVKNLKLLVMTHPDADHIGSMDAVLREMDVETLVLPAAALGEDAPATQCFLHVLDVLDEKPEIELAVAQSGLAFAIGTGRLTVVLAGLAGESGNNESVCTRYTMGSFAFLDTGDAEQAAEQLLMAGEATITATVFKAAHHGSHSSNSVEFMQAVAPQCVVVSCGQGNRYGHPHPEPMEAFAAVGAAVYRTDAMGTVVITGQENGTFTAKTERNG